MIGTNRDLPQILTLNDNNLNSGNNNNSDNNFNDIEMNIFTDHELIEKEPEIEKVHRMAIDELPDKVKWEYMTVSNNLNKQ